MPPYSGPRITITMDATVLEEMRVFMARKSMKAHDQSKLITRFVREGLEREGFPVKSSGGVGR